MIETRIVETSDSDVLHVGHLNTPRRVLAGAIIFLGPPGAGKGTQARHLANEFHLPHISTGDVFRLHVAKRTALGMRAAETMNRGRLVPDELVCEMLSDHIFGLGSSCSLILDGFPRSVAQAKWLESFFNTGVHNLQRNPPVAVHIDIQRDLLLLRLGGRRNCPSCGRVYNLHSHPPRNAGVCDYDNAELVMRTDDSERVVRERLAIHDQNALPVAEHYRRRGRLLEIDGNGTVETMRTAIAEGLNSMFAFAPI
jgi:adenylate kinase